MDLINIFEDYRNGNKKALDKLFRSNVEKNKIGDYIQGNLIILDEELFFITNKIYRYYSTPYKFAKKNKDKKNNDFKENKSAKDKRYATYNEPPPKFREQVYCGSLNDLMSDAVLVLYKMFDDKSFVPQTSDEIYIEFYYRLLKCASDNIESSAYSIFENVFCENCDGEELSLFDLVAVKNNNSRMSSKYHGIFQEIASIIDNYDVKSLLKGDAFVQRNIIDLIRKYYKPTYDPQTDMNTYPKQKDMISYYQHEYGETISQPVYSAAVEGILKAICECTITLKGKSIKRSDFIKNMEENREENDI